MGSRTASIALCMTGIRLRTTFLVSSAFHIIRHCRSNSSWTISVATPRARRRAQARRDAHGRDPSNTSAIDSPTASMALCTRTNLASAAPAGELMCVEQAAQQYWTHHDTMSYPSSPSSNALCIAAPTWLANASGVAEAANWRKRANASACAPNRCGSPRLICGAVHVASKSDCRACMASLPNGRNDTRLPLLVTNGCRRRRVSLALSLRNGPRSWSSRCVRNDLKIEAPTMRIVLPSWSAYRARRSNVSSTCALPTCSSRALYRPTLSLTASTAPDRSPAVTLVRTTAIRFWTSSSIRWSSRRS